MDTDYKAAKAVNGSEAVNDKASASPRKAAVTRVTAETNIAVALNLDEQTGIDVSTGIGFFDHMLTLFAKHGRFGLTVKAHGDTYIDAHHTVEDVALALGQGSYAGLG